MQIIDEQDRSRFQKTYPLMVILFLWSSIYIVIDESPVFYSIPPLLNMLLSIIIGSAVYAGVTGSLYDISKDKESSVSRLFFENIRCFFFPFLGISVLTTILSILFNLLRISIFQQRYETTPSGSPLFLAITGLIVFCLRIIWRTSSVSENRRMWKGLFRGFKVLLCHRKYLFTCTAYSLVFAAEYMLFEVYRGSIQGFGFWLMVLLRAGLLALLGVYFYFGAITIYNQSRVEFLGEQVTVARRVKIRSSKQKGPSILLAIFSFVPVVNILAIIGGWRSSRRNHWSSVKSLLTFALGLFFTLLYAITGAGWILTMNQQSPDFVYQNPDYIYIIEAQPSLEPMVALLEQERFSAAAQELDRYEKETNTDSWPFLTAMALARSGAGDTITAERYLSRAIAADPPAAGFFYHCGSIYMSHGRHADAAEYFIKALAIDPGMDQADRMLQVTQSLYSPSRVLTIVWSILILLTLFTFHEYAHAYSAHRFGDDTAKAAGRLTLNPIAHLDLIGSIILPAVLLFRQAEVVFGWAKPVPVNPDNYSDKKRGTIFVSFAGSGMNLAMALAAFLLILFIMLLIRVISPDVITYNIADPYAAFAVANSPLGPVVSPLLAFLKQFLLTSLVLGFLNLLPIPPFDGSWILSSLLPDRMKIGFEKVRKFSFIFVLLIVFTPVLDYVLLVPIYAGWSLLYLCFAFMGVG
jgi:Zn-dependent protease